MKCGGRRGGKRGGGGAFLPLLVRENMTELLRAKHRGDGRSVPQKERVRISFSSFPEKRRRAKKNIFFGGTNVRRGPQQKSEGGHQFSTLTESFFLSTALTPVSLPPRRMMPKSGVKKEGGEGNELEKLRCQSCLPPQKKTPGLVEGCMYV